MFSLLVAQFSNLLRIQLINVQLYKFLLQFGQHWKRRASRLLYSLLRFRRRLPWTHTTTPPYNNKYNVIITCECRPVITEGCNHWCRHISFRFHYTFCCSAWVMLCTTLVFSKHGQPQTKKVKHSKNVFYLEASLTKSYDLQKI